MKPALLPELDVHVPPEGLSISDAARATGVSIDTLRYYERVGLLLNPAPRNGSGRRRYRAADLAWIAGLVMLRETGIPIAGMREMAELSRVPGTEAERLVALEAHRDRVVQDLERTRAHLAALDRKIASYQQVVSTTETTSTEPRGTTR